MPRYFFHVRNQTSYTRDEDGVALADVGAARAQAADAAGEILTSELRDGNAGPVFEIHVDDATSRRVLTLHVSGTFSAT